MYWYIIDTDNDAKVVFLSESIIQAYKLILQSNSRKQTKIGLRVII